MQKKLFKILLCIPPAYDTVYPPLGTAALAGFLNSKGISAYQKDLNIEFLEYVRKNGFEYMFGNDYKKKKKREHIYYHKELAHRGETTYWFENMPGAGFDFTERLLSSKNLFRYIEDEKKNIFNRFFKEDVLNKLKKERFDMVGFSVTAPSQVISTFTFGSIIKSEIPGSCVVMGGQWPSLFKEELLKRKDFNAFYDYLIYNEGETPLYALIDSLIKKKSLSQVPNLIYREKNGFVLSQKVSEEDMDRLPAPDFDGLPLNRYRSLKKDKTISLTFETSRGCYWNRCIFCVDLPFPKPRYREKAAGLLVKEIKTLKVKYKAKEIFISSAVFSPWHMEKFCREMIRQGVKIRWKAFARFEKEFTEKMLALVKKAGCRKLGFGFESINQRLLDFCDKGTNVKIIKRIIRDSRKIKLNIHYQAMTGMPSETIEESMENISFLAKCPEKATFNIYYLTPKNYVFENPKKYGARLKPCAKLPFRFFYPFTHTSKNAVDRNTALRLTRFYKYAHLKNRGLLPK